MSSLFNTDAKKVGFSAVMPLAQVADVGCFLTNKCWFSWFAYWIIKFVSGCTLDWTKQKSTQLYILYYLIYLALDRT